MDIEIYVRITCDYYPSNKNLFKSSLTRSLNFDFMKINKLDSSLSGRELCLDVSLV